MNWEFHIIKLPVSGVIILEPNICQRILCFMLGQSILKLTITLSGSNINLKQLDVRFISTADQVADGFIKALSVRQLNLFRNNLNLQERL